MWQALAALLALVALIVVPPLVSLNHYQRRITGLMAASLGRPVRMSHVSARLLPRPAFELTNLTVEEDPAYGAEPVLHASTVVAPIRLLALWRGKLEISRIVVDEASVNLVRMPDGKWNMNSLFGRAAVQAGAGAAAMQHHLPYLRATHSRINVKMGAEKLPFSLTDTNVSLWEEKPGEWRLELKGQPSRTDLNLNQGDTGVVELKASVRNAAQLRQMPVVLDMEWREAQMGQLTRLVLGRDPGWRGDLRGNLHLEGTAEAAQVKTRLRATGVHRAEFTPASPLDFDANCGFLYHFSAHSLEKLSCVSPLGSGRVRIEGALPGPGQAQLTAELDKIPVAAALDALRTVRSEVPSGLVAEGSVSGRITYANGLPAATEPAAPAKVVRASAKNRKQAPEELSPLSGSLTVEGFKLTGGGLNQPVESGKFELRAAEGRPAALAGSTSFALGGTVPVEAEVRLTEKKYFLTLRGQASLARVRELAHASGLKGGAALDALAGDALSVDLAAHGAWMPVEEIASAQDGTDGSLEGTLTFRNANWKSDSLVNAVLIQQATLHLDKDSMRWDPVAFSYGPLKGTATVNLRTGCEGCVPRIDAEFAELDAATLQAALLGARTKGTLISEILAKIHPATPAVWPRLEGTVKAEVFKVGPVSLHKTALNFTMNAAGVEIGGLDGDLLGGHAHLSGSIKPGSKTGDKPAYELEGSAEKLNPAAVGQLLGEHWSGGELKLQGKFELAGYTGDDLASSAKGTLHMDWKRGAVAGAAVPATLNHFTSWSAEAEMGGGELTIRQNEVVGSKGKSAVEGSVPLSLPAKIGFGASKDTARSKR